MTGLFINQSNCAFSSYFLTSLTVIPSLLLGGRVNVGFKMAEIECSGEENIRIDEVEMGDVTTADGILAKEKEKFEYIHGHVEHQELHVPQLDELSRGMFVFSYARRTIKSMQ